MFSRLVWESDPREQPKDLALLVAHRSARIPALLCLRVVQTSSTTLVLLQMVPMLKVLVTMFFSIAGCLFLLSHTEAQVQNGMRDEQTWPLCFSSSHILFASTVAYV